MCFSSCSHWTSQELPAKQPNPSLIAPSLLKAAWVPSGKATHRLGFCHSIKPSCPLKEFEICLKTQSHGALSPAPVLPSYIGLSLVCRDGVKPCPWAVQPSWVSPGQGLSQGGLGALDSPLPAWFAVSGTETDHVL